MAEEQPVWRWNGRRWHVFKTYLLSYCGLVKKDDCIDERAAHPQYTTDGLVCLTCQRWYNRWRELRR